MTVHLIPPIKHLRPLMRAIETGQISADLAAQAFVDHGPYCLSKATRDTYGAPVFCSCRPKITLYVCGAALELLDDGSLRLLSDH